MQPTRDLLITPTRFWKQRVHPSDIGQPRPFRVRLDPAIRHVWGGVVAEPGHPLDDLPVYLSQRNSEWTGEVEVEVSPGDPDHYSSGYASLEPRPETPPIAGAAVAVDPDAPLTPWRELLIYWEDMDYRRVVTHGQAEVASLEQHYGVQLPADFRQYLLHACSTLDDGRQMDDHNAWWGLERIRSIVEECDDQSPIPLALDPTKTLVFVDHMIWCWAWAICCDGGPNHGRVMIIGSPDRWVADSFAEFVSRYVDDQQSLY